jgi:lipopolysaccharide assembly outer membrane protein LptD (OstA)
LDFLSVRISQGFDFLRAEEYLNETSINEYSYISGLWQGLTNTTAELTIKPHSLIDLVAQGEYDPVNNRARRYSLDLGLMDHRGDLIRVFHQFTEDEAAKDMNRQTNVNLQLKLTSSLDCFVENQYSHQFDFSYFTSAGLVYHPQCWNVVLRYSQTKEKDPVTQQITTPDQSIFMTLSLLGLGQVYQTTRDWRELLGRSSRTGPSSGSK